MSDKIINQRQIAILENLSTEKTYALKDIVQIFNKAASIPSAATLRRDLANLCDLELLKVIGDKKSARYKLTIKGTLERPIDAQKYCAIEIDLRATDVKFNQNLFKQIKHPLFNEAEIENLEISTKSFLRSSESLSPGLTKKELERFIIELSWKSSKIEGNTYSLLDTERLIRHGIESEGHSKEEAIMILNHKSAFNYIIGAIKHYRNLMISEISDIHHLLIKDLNIALGLRTKPVGITGSAYRPLNVPFQIKEALEELCKVVNDLEDPYSKALLTLIGIAYIQPFEDGNKRTSRLAANAVLLSHNCAPLSYRSINEIAYKEAMLVFYEKNSLYAIKQIFIEQYIFACENYLKVFTMV